MPPNRRNPRSDRPHARADIRRSATPSAWEPLKTPTYRLLWGTWLIANICMWMNDVAAAWMMTSLTDSPIWVALVQTASTLPVFMLGLPSGAMADILDRRRYFIVTQFWLAGTAVILSVTVVMGLTAPWLQDVQELASQMPWPTEVVVNVNA